MEETTPKATPGKTPLKRRRRRSKTSAKKNATPPITKRSYSGKKRGRKKGWNKRTPASSPTGINFTVKGGVLIMNSIPKHVTSMVFVKGSILTTVDI